MSANVSWFVCAVAGFGVLWLMKLTPPAVDKVLKRLAGLLFLAGGLAGLTGWVGQAVTATLGALKGWLDAIGVAAVSTPLYWIIAAAVAFSWLAGMLPDKVVRGTLPTWLVYAGLILPALLTTVPGQLGAGLRSVTYAAGGMVGGWLGGLIA